MRVRSKRSARKSTSKPAMLAGFSHEQSLTPRRMSLDELFLPVFQGRKRGDEHRI